MNYAVILAGGVGSRFWPFSRELEPKQFMQLAGDKTLLQATVGRLHTVVSPANTYIVTNQIYLNKVIKEIEKFRIPEENIILEPEGKNTAPAIGLCARLIGRIDNDATLVILPSDHYIKNLDKFRKSLKQAITCAQGGFLVTIGIRPKNPSTGYGYIKVSSQPSALSRQLNYYKVEKFLEKPSLVKAKKYFKGKNFFWNSGIFIWKASVFLSELKLYLPKLHMQLISIKSVDDIAKVWHKITPVSVDYGIMEHSKRIALIPASFYWTDLGSWDALNNVLPKDTKGNIIQADSIDLDSRDIYVFGRGNRLISTIGLKSLIIADTPDALLICNKDKTQDVKKIVDKLKSSKRKEQFVHLTEKRQWGSYTVLREMNGFKIKLIEIEPKKSLSLQRHKHRAEHWVVVSGTARVVSLDGIKLVQSNQSVYIPKGAKHRLTNPTNKPLQIVEVQTGNYLGEDDIERF